MPTGTTAEVREIGIAHSPDSDDAFMFYGLASEKVQVPGYRFTHTLTDIETLNQKAMREAMGFLGDFFARDHWSACNLAGQLRDAQMGHTPLQDPRRFPQQLVGCAADRRRRMA